MLDRLKLDGKVSVLVLFITTYKGTVIGNDRMNYAA